MTLEEAAGVVEQLRARLDARYLPYIYKPRQDEPRGHHAGEWEVHVYNAQPEGVVYYLITTVPDDIGAEVASLLETSQ